MFACVLTCACIVCMCKFDSVILLPAGFIGPGGCTSDISSSVSQLLKLLFSLLMKPQESK